MSDAWHSNEFILLIGAGPVAPATKVTPAADTYTRFALIKNLAFALSSSVIDTTTKDTDGWASNLEGGGQKSVQVTGTGNAFSNDDWEQMVDIAYGRSNWNFQIKDAGGNIREGRFTLSQFDEQGDTNDLHSFSFTLISDGPVKFTKAPVTP